MEREYVFHSQNLRIAGTFSEPANTNKAAVLFLGGSFPQVRDGNVDNGHTEWFPIPFPSRNLFRDEAKLLSVKQISSLRYDKRGCGQSEGDFNSSGLLDFKNDAIAAIKSLQENVNANKYGVIGQSEGAILALMLAAELDSIDFIILQGCPFINLAEIVKWQANAFLQKSEDDQLQLKQVSPLMYHFYMNFEDIIHKASDGEKYYLLGDADWNLNFYLPWLKEHFDNPPSAYLDQVKCPVLILQGELDHNVPVAEAAKLKENLEKTGNTNTVLKIFPGLDHSFRRLGTPDEDFITSMQRPLDQEMIDSLLAWLDNELY